MQKPKPILFSFWTFQIAGWLLVELVITFKLFFRQSISGETFQLNYFLLTISLDSISFILTIGMRYIYRWLMKRDTAFIKLLILGVGLSFIVAMIPYPIELMLRPLYKLEQFKNFGFLRAIYSATWDFPIYFGWSLLYFGLKLWKQSLADKEQMEKANFLAQTAQLQMLRYQLNPHFLFNSLNSIWALIDEDKKASKEMVSELSEFLRYSLTSKSYSDVPLRQEIEATGHYLAIEKKRFEQKLEVNFDIEPEAEDFPVLSFILNPLVENAIKYGMRTSVMPLKIGISAKVENRQLTLQVQNTGKWLPPVEKENGNGTSTGLQNIRLRLDNAFHGRSGFNIGEFGDKVIATIVIHGRS